MLATPPGKGGVAIVRVSGPGAPALCEKVSHALPPPRYAHYGPFFGTDSDVIDVGLTLYFPAPRSFTGEDVVEFHLHGGPFVVDILLQRCYSLGARPAKPGEFSERAFLNGKIDLAQAEAIADLIDSESEKAARSAVNSLRGEFSAKIDGIIEALIGLRVYVEAALDFPEEEIDFLADGVVETKLLEIKKKLADTLAKAEQGALLREGMTLVIAGRPNAGKSSLLNALAAYESAIVTDVEGTTRDVLKEQISLDGVPIHVVDTAGLRDSEDPVEKLGIERAWKEIAGADFILLLVDAEKGFGKEEETILSRFPKASNVIKVYNKLDRLSPQNIEQGLEDGIYISAKFGTGLEELKQRLLQEMGHNSAIEGAFVARRRHLAALKAAFRDVELAEHQLTGAAAGELVAEELRSAQDELATITGRFTFDDLLGEIFSSFCIGK